MYKVLFICKHNAGRSVLAESIATHILPADFSVASGGSHPTGKVHPVVQKYLDDHQLPIPHIHTHSWEERTQFLLTSLLFSVTLYIKRQLLSGLRVAFE